jgi:hypothetical protein
MSLRIRHIATRFALLLASAAVAPLLVYGFVSLVSLQRGPAIRSSPATRTSPPRRRRDPPLRDDQRPDAEGTGRESPETGLQTWQQSAA